LFDFGSQFARLKRETEKYEKEYFKRDYKDISFITEDERDALISCCKTFNEVVPNVILPPKIKKQFNGTKLTPWEDYNAKVSIWDIIRDDFVVTGKIAGKTQIRRHGSKRSLLKRFLVSKSLINFRSMSIHSMSLYPQISA